MQRKNGWMKCLMVLALGVAFYPSPLGAQILERANLGVGASTQSNAIAVSPDDVFVVVNDQDQIIELSTEYFDLFNPQPDPLTARTESYGFLVNSDSLFAYPVDSMITRILVDDPLNNLLTVDLTGQINEGAANMVIDPESVDNHLYLMTFDTKTVYEYTINTQTVGNTPFIITDPNIGTVNNMTYIALPTTNGEGGETDKIAITTNNGRVVFIDENLNPLVVLPLLNTAPNCPPPALTIDANVLPAAAVNSVRNLLFVLNRTDNVVHVIDTINLTELADSPICLHQGNDMEAINRDINNEIKDIATMLVRNPLNRDTGFVTGELGVTMINLNPNQLEVIDAVDPDGENPDFINSIPTTAVPDKIAVSSKEDGYIYTADVNNTLSVISDNPFVTIGSVTPDTVNAGDPAFNLTWQVDELCTGCSYRVRLNGDINESGTLLLEGQFTDADMVNVDMTTPDININDFPAGTFAEGQNQIYIFSDDENGFTGRDSVFIDVDTPPPDVTILDVNFGNMKGFVTIERLTQEDIAQYNIYVLEALDQNNPTCPGGLDFGALAAPTATVSQPDSGSKVKITITGLTNLTAYCVGIQAQDNGGNLSPNIVVATEPIIPEVTIGITQAAGEAGCRLNPQTQGKGARTWVLLILSLLGLLTAFRVKGLGRWGLKLFQIGLIAVVLLVQSVPAQAVEYTDQHWAFHFQGGFYLPKTGSFGRFLDTCCNPMLNMTFGRLWRSQFEVNLGAGIMWQQATAIGAVTGRESGERFSIMTVPISNSFVYHADFVENQLLVPYVTVGIDYMYFRQNLQGDVTQGWKFGYHAGGGLQILLEFFDDAADTVEQWGINDIYLTLEGKWIQIDNFGGGGLAFNGFSFMAGLLFEF